MSTWTAVVFFPEGEYSGKVTHKLRFFWKLIPCKYVEPYLGAYVVGNTQADSAMLCVIRNGDRHTSYLNRLGNSLHFILSFLLAGLQSSGHSLIFGERAVVRFIVTSLSVQLLHNQWTGSFTGLGRQICRLPSRVEALRGIPCRSRSLSEACFAGLHTHPHPVSW